MSSGCETNACSPASQNQFDRLSRLLQHDVGERRIFVDFDHTVFLSNSTEEFLDCARPRFLAAFALRALGALMPCSAGPDRPRGFVWRDPVRVLAILILMPWTLLLFRRNARAIFERDCNRVLMAILTEYGVGRVTIVSFGLDFVIRRLVAGTPLEGAPIISSSLKYPVRIRRDGKASSLMGTVDADPSRDVFITDSEVDDADALARFRNSFHIRWAAEKNISAHAMEYVPFFYMDKIKRPNLSFFFKIVILDDFALLALCFLIFQPFHWSIWICGLSLFLAFMAAYEIGYVENDRVGLLHEEKPKLSAEFYRYKDYKIEPNAWYWTAGLTLFGVFVLDAEYVLAAVARLDVNTDIGPTAGRIIIAAVWFAGIGVTRLLFFAFNHATMLWRIALIFPLHLAKYFAPLLVFSAGWVGIALLFAQIVRTWSKYAIRRSGGDLELFPGHLTRLMFFLFLLAIFGSLTTFGEVLGSWQAVVVVVWSVVRGIPEISRTLFNPSPQSTDVPKPNSA